jgi:hypothetical protein
VAVASISSSEKSFAEEEAEREDRRPQWLVEAHEHSTVRWYPRLLQFDELNVWRVDEHPDGYQRPLKEARVAQIASNFDSVSARDLYVAQRADKSFWILDGQHTAEAMRRLGFNAWLCRVIGNISITQEAEWFDYLNNNTQKIPSVIDHAAKVVSGNKISLLVDKVLSDYYLRISSARIRAREGDIGFASATMFDQILRLGGEQLLRETLQLSVDAWGHRKTSFMGRVMSGISYLLAWNEVPLDRARMLAVLNNITPAQIVEDLGSTGTGGGPAKCARMLVDLYVAGVPSIGYPKIRANGADAPTLPDRKIARGEGSKLKEFWTAETAQIGRRTMTPFVPTPKPSAVAAEADVADMIGSDVVAPTEDSVTADTAPTEAAEAPESPQEVIDLDDGLESETASPEAPEAISTPEKSPEASAPVDVFAEEDVPVQVAEDEDWEYPEDVPAQE